MSVSLSDKWALRKQFVSIVENQSKQLFYSWHSRNSRGEVLKISQKRTCHKLRSESERLQSKEPWKRFWYVSSCALHGKEIHAIHITARSAWRTWTDELSERFSNIMQKTKFSRLLASKPMEFLLRCHC